MAAIERGRCDRSLQHGNRWSIHAGIAADLIERCADVHLKERRPLVIAPREMPFNLIHLRNLTGLRRSHHCPTHPGVVHPAGLLEAMVDFLVVRLFDGLEDELAPLNCWNGPLNEHVSAAVADSCLAPLLALLVLSATTVGDKTRIRLLVWTTPATCWGVDSIRWRWWCSRSSCRSVSAFTYGTSSASQTPFTRPARVQSDGLQR